MLIEPYEEGSTEVTMQKINGKDVKISVRDKEEIDLPWGGKLVYVNSIVGGAIDARFSSGNPKGIMEKMETGPLTGSYARDIRYMSMTVRCIRSILTKYLSGLPVEMPSVRHSRLPGLRSLNRFMMLR